MFTIPFRIITLLLGILSLAAADTSVYQTALLIGANNSETDYVVATLQSYSSPYQLLIIPQTGTTLPTLENTTTSIGNYGLIIILEGASYDYGGSRGWDSAITTAQWTEMWNYQTKYGVRMIQLNVSPFQLDGVAPANSTNGTNSGCCTVEEQYVSLITDYPAAGLRAGNLSTLGLYHAPAVVTDASTVTPIMKFYSNLEFPEETIAGVIKNWGNGREEMDFFMTGDISSLTTAYFGHLWFTWGYRGLYTGFRRIYFNTQVDDLFLTTELHQVTPNPQGPRARINVSDLDNHVMWQADINRMMNPGSKYILELGFNGNGNEQQAAPASNWQCPPAVVRQDPPTPTEDAEFVKPLNSGQNMWNSTVQYIWNISCVLLDPLASYTQDSERRDSFAWVSHTFTHENLDNATYSDTFSEISFNKEHAMQLGFPNAKYFSAEGLIPPAITGLHNGDALRAFYENGLRYVVGDNTRDALRNPTNYYWPLETTDKANGFAGIQITPRWSTRVYWDCSNTDENVDEWHQTLPEKGDIYDLLIQEKIMHPTYLLGLHHDPFMFHQANLRVVDVWNTTINGISKQRGLLQMWVETVVTEVNRLVNWPMITKTHDDIGIEFANRMARDLCVPNIRWIHSTTSGQTVITGFEVSATNLNCSQPVPVTIPVGSVTSLQGSTSEQIGEDPLTIWVSLNGTSKVFNLTSGINMNDTASTLFVANGSTPKTTNQVSIPSLAPFSMKDSTSAGVANISRTFGVVFLSFIVGLWVF